MTYELIIIGGGPAGASGAVYAGRKQINTLVLKKEWGGQSVVSPDIHNWIGTPSIAGTKLAEDLKTHVEAYKGDILSIKDEEVANISKTENGFFVETKDGNKYTTKTILITTGSNRKQLEVPGAAQLEHKGLTYCASCDGLFFAGLDVVVIGAGNSAFESALQLLAYCKSVTILARSENIKADPLTVEAVKKDPKAKIIFNTEITEVLGDKKVEGIKYKDLKSGEIITLSVQGIFVEIGQVPATSFAKDLVNIDKFGRIEIDPWTQKTSALGIWAAGDCTNVKYHQNNIAAGDGVRALEDIYTYIKSNS